MSSRRDSERYAPTEYVPRLDYETKVRVMGAVLFNVRAFKAFEKVYSPKFFDKTVDFPLILLWRLASDYFREFNELPTEQVYLLELYREARNDSDITDRIQRQAEEILSEGVADILESENVQAFVNWALSQIQKWSYSILSDALGNSIGNSNVVARDFHELLDRALQGSKKAKSILTPRSRSRLFPERGTDWLQSVDRQKISTGCPFLNRFLGEHTTETGAVVEGGFVRGEVYTLASPYGGGKTSLTLQLCCEQQSQALVEYHETRANRIGLVFYFFYEMDIDQVRDRIVSYSAQVPLTILKSVTSMQELSRTGRLRRYEEELFEERLRRGSVVHGEYERIRTIESAMNRHVRTIDMAENALVGAGGINEIAQIVEDELNDARAEFPDSEVYVRFIAVDYVGAMVLRMRSAGTIRQEEERSAIGHAPLLAKTELGKTYNCPVFLVHQLSTQGNTLAPGQLPKRTDKAGARNFDENADFAFVTSLPNAQDLFLLGATKHRRTGQVPPVVLRLRGDFCRIESTDGNYVLNPRTNTIVSRAEMEVAGGGAVNRGGVGANMGVMADLGDMEDDF